MTTHGNDRAYYLFGRASVCVCSPLHNISMRSCVYTFYDYALFLLLLLSVRSRARMFVCAYVSAKSLRIFRIFVFCFFNLFGSWRLLLFGRSLHKIVICWMHNGHCVRMCIGAPALAFAHSREKTQQSLRRSYSIVQFFCLRHSRFACSRDKQIISWKRSNWQQPFTHTHNSALASSMTNHFAYIRAFVVVSLFRFTAKVHTFTCAHAS